jgi:TolB-like protein
VTASASSSRFRDRRNDIPAIGRALNVANILDGSVRAPATSCAWP